jgi:hypothetical protein
MPACKTNILTILMHQMSIYTIYISSVKLSPKKVENKKRTKKNLETVKLKPEQRTIPLSKICRMIER